MAEHPSDGTETARGRAGMRYSRRGLVDKVLPQPVTFAVPRIRRGGYVFLAWVGDHGPRHVHVYRDGKLVVKWDLDNWQPMKGEATARVKTLLSKLVEEGEL